MKYSIAIDQSTSSTKVLLVDSESRVVDKASLPHKQIYPQAGWVEHDAEEIWQNLQTIAGTLLTRHADKLSDIHFVSITNQRETMLVFDSKTGTPVANAIVWQCNRGEAICEALRELPDAHNFKVISGLEIDTYFSGSKLKWMIDHDPSLASKLSSGDYRFGNIDTYLIYRLTNGQVYATDHTNASRTLLYDLKQRCWSPWLCQKIGVDIKNLPHILDCDAKFGETDFGGLLPSNLPISGVMGDSQAALFAQRCFKPGSIKVTLGTGSSMLYNIGPEEIQSQNGIVTTLASVIHGKPTYSFEGIIRFSSATMDWLANQLQLFTDIQEADSLASQVEDSAGVYLVPAFGGLGVPYWKGDCKAAIVGLTTHSDRKHIIRAGLESMAWQIREAIELMETETRRKCDCLNVDGGPTKSAFLMQLISDILQRDIEVNHLPECSAIGANMAGLLGTRAKDSLEALQKLPKESTRYTSQKTPDQILSQYEGWKHAIQQVMA